MYDPLRYRLLTSTLAHDDTHLAHCGFFTCWAILMTLILGSFPCPPSSISSGASITWMNSRHGLCIMKYIMPPSFTCIAVAEKNELHL